MSAPWEVRQGDALALLRDLPDGGVDAVITDPPYSSGGFTRGDRMASTGAKYTDANTIVNGRGWRYCRQCHNAAQRAKREQARAS